MEIDHTPKLDGQRLSGAGAGVSMSLAIWDAHALERQVGKNTVVQGRILAKFLSLGQLQVGELMAAAAQPTRFAELAHKLKSSARSVGALQMGESCQQAERAGCDGQVAHCLALAQEVAEGFAKVAQVIQESLD